MNNNQIYQNFIKASNELKENGLVVGEVRDEKDMEVILTPVSTGHSTDLDHRELLFQVIRENLGEYGVSEEQVKEILMKFNKDEV
jgi:hypothetical protein